MKTAIVLVLAALVACASASGCDTLARIKVKGQWSRAYGSGNDRQNFIIALIRAFFAQAPESSYLFSRVYNGDYNSGVFRAHAERVVSGLDAAVNLLDQPETLKAELDHLREQHEPRNIPAKYYTVFRNALEVVLPAQLEQCFDKQAWRACFDVIAAGIQGQ